MQVKEVDDLSLINSGIYNNQYLCRMYIKHPEHGTAFKIYDKNGFLKKTTSGELNCYQNLNPLKKVDGKVLRRKGYEASLQYLYIDLDVYHSSFAQDFYGKNPDEMNFTIKQFDELKRAVQYELTQEHFNRTLPVPSYIVDSGRGLYLLWKIDEHINAMPRWNKVQRYLHSILDYYGSDAQVVSDSVRVLRCIGSVNSKTNTSVSIISGNESFYTLYEIMNGYMPQKEAKITPKMKRAILAICQSKGITLPAFEGLADARAFIGQHYKKSKIRNDRTNKKIYFNAESAYTNKLLCDLTWLLQNTRDIPENGKKELIFFQIAFLLAKSGKDKEYISNHIKILNNGLTHKKEERELLKEINSYTWASDRYKNYYSKDKLLDILKVTKEEQDHLQYLKEKGAKRNYREQYVSKTHKNGKLLNEERKTLRYRSILSFQKQNYTAYEMALELNVCVRTVRRDIAHLQTLGEESILKLQEKSTDCQEEEQQNEKVGGFPEVLHSQAKGDKKCALKLYGRSPVAFSFPDGTLLFWYFRWDTS